MNSKNNIYFFRSNDKFLDFLERNKNLKKFHCKNEELFSYSLINDISINKKKMIIDSEIIIISSEIAFHFLKIFLDQNPKIKNFFLNKKLIIIGDVLAQKIFDYNLKNIFFKGKNIVDVLNFLKYNLEDHISKKILYLRGDVIKIDLKNSNDLKKLEKFDELVVYNVFYKKNFSDKFLSDLKQKKIQSLVFFSQKSFENFSLILDSKILLKELLKNIKTFFLGDFLENNPKKNENEKIFQKIIIEKNCNSKELAKLIEKFSI